MKVKIISLFFLLSMCSANTVENSYIEVSDNDFLNLKTIQNNEKISIIIPSRNVYVLIAVINGFLNGIL